MPRYFIGTVLYFWMPVIFLWMGVGRKMDRLSKKAFFISLLIIAPMTFVMEYVYLWADIWTFSEKMDPLLGVWLWGAPLEEFSFWFGAAPFILLVYLMFDRLFPKGKRGRGAGG